MGRFETRTFALRGHGEAVLRVPEPADAERIVEMQRAVVLEGHAYLSEPDEFDLTTTDGEAWIQALNTPPASLALVAEVAGKVVGWIKCEHGASKRTAHRADVEIGVDRPFRGRGIGAALMRAMLDWAEQNPLLERLQGAAYATNAGSLALCKRTFGCTMGWSPRSTPAWGACSVPSSDWGYGTGRPSSSLRTTATCRGPTA